MMNMIRKEIQGVEKGDISYRVFIAQIFELLHNQIHSTAFLSSKILQHNRKRGFHVL